jgi:uncharacterized lipoprotein YddW (UPF0748 family)
LSSAVTRRNALAALAAGALAGCANPPRLGPLLAEPPPAPRELRGAWVASVANIDWPRPAGRPEAEQRAQVSAMVERASALGLNALLLQVRPAADALYASTLEPASEFVSGTQGLAPSYDPLQLWIDAAHARGIELHAWFNPFRARHPSAKSALAPNHVARREPGWVKPYGDALWLDPGEPGAVAHTLAVIDDVVRRYDIDAVHLDDYFYPYPVAELPFPDDASHARSGSTLARDDWRRDNVTRFVRMLYERVHAIKRDVKVGISPFALPRRERRPAGIEGFDPHARLYADAELWLEQGWLDYIAPQLYWPLAQRAQAFDVLLDHWAATNRRGRHLWPGLFTSRVANPWPADEIVNQLAHLRTNSAKASGHIHFSMVALMDDRGGLASRLLASAPGPALPPATPWLAGPALARPTIETTPAGVRFTLAGEAPSARWLAVWQRARGSGWRLSLHDARSAPRVPWVDARGAPLEAVAACAVCRAGIEHARTAAAVLPQD